MAGRVGALSKNFSGMVGVSNVVAGRVGALSKNFSGMVGASNVVVRTVGALVVRVSALAVMVGAQAGGYQRVLGLV